MKRRNFLKYTSTLPFAPLLLNGTSVSTFLAPSMLSLMNCEEVNDRALVILQLEGGNDGLNTLIPIPQYDTYVSYRPNLAIPQNQLLDLTDSNLNESQQVGLHPSLSGLQSLYNSGKVNIIRSVAYENQNLSHFKSTDLWLSGGDGTPAHFNYDTGWMGRFLEAAYPNVQGQPTAEMPDPLGIQIGIKRPSLGFYTHNLHPTALNLADQDPAGFYSLINEFGGQPITNVPNSIYGNHLNYIMSTEQSTTIYAERVSNVFNAGSNMATYPDTNLASQFKTVARLISGGCKTKIYLVHIVGFDTHAEQAEVEDSTIGVHASLLQEVSDAIAAFQSDLAMLGKEDQVLTVTFSEFGRKATENGSRGTDHGTLAPMFVFGSAVQAGMVGQNPDISVLGGSDGTQLTNPQHDYRQVYATLLQDWLGADNSLLEAAYFGNWSSQKLPIVSLENIVSSECYLSGTLSVQTLTLSAKVMQHKKVLLEWQTEVVEEAAHFEIERSRDAKNFTKIDEVEVWQLMQMVYHYTDASPLLGKSYYRIKLVSKAKPPIYSDTKAIELQHFSKAKLFPNPATFQTQLVLNVNQAFEATLILTDVSGHHYWQKLLYLEKGYQKIVIPLVDLEVGQYWIYLKGKGLERQWGLVKI